MGDWFDEGRSGAVLALPELFTGELVDALVRVLGTGALVSVSVSRDGGALGFTVTSDGRWRREWFRDGGEASEWLNAGADWLAANPPATADRVPGSRWPRDGARKRS